jgi:hypothetical protein
VPPAYACERCATARRESASVQSDNPSKATNFDEELTGRRQHREPAGRRFTHAGSGEQEGDGGEEESGGQHAAKDGQSRETWVDRQEHRGRDLNCAEHRRKRIHRENVVEPAHERAVGNQRLDALCLISGELQRADPGDDDDEAVPADNARSCQSSRPSDGCLQYSGRSSWRFPVLARYAQAVRTMADYAAEGSGVVRLGIPLELPPTVLPGTLSRFAAHCPHARVVPMHLSTAAQIAALRSDDLDVGLVRERPAGSEFDAMLVVRESLGILIASDVAAKLSGPDGISLDALGGMDWVGFSRTHSPAFGDLQ